MLFHHFSGNLKEICQTTAYLFSRTRLLTATTSLIHWVFSCFKNSELYFNLTRLFKACQINGFRGWVGNGFPKRLVLGPENMCKLDFGYFENRFGFIYMHSEAFEAESMHISVLGLLSLI